MRPNDPARFAGTVTVYSFILTVLVIWIHAVDPVSAADAALGAGGAVLGGAEALGAGVISGAGAMAGQVSRFLQSLLGSGLGQIAVPGFFCMSGYLFFRNCGSRSTESGATDVGRGGGRFAQAAGSGLPTFFFGKWKSRVRTLVLPYLIWNFLYYLIYLAAGRASFGAAELGAALLDYRYNPVFWYLKELIMITAVTPLIFLLLKKKALVPFVLAAVYLAAVWYDRLPAHWINEDALFYYMTGAALALHAREKETDGAALGRLFVLSGIVFLLCEAVYLSRSPVWIMFGIVGGRAAGPLALFAGLSLLMDRIRGGRRAVTELADRENAKVELTDGVLKKEGPGMRADGMESDFAIPDYMQYNFWIYAVHYLEIRFFRAAVVLLFGQPLPEAVHLLLYLLMPLLCIAAGVVTGGLLKKKAAPVYAVLTGGRS